MQNTTYHSEQGVVDRVVVGNHCSGRRGETASRTRHTKDPPAPPLQTPNTHTHTQQQQQQTTHMHTQEVTHAHTIKLAPCIFQHSTIPSPSSSVFGNVSTDVLTHS